MQIVVLIVLRNAGFLTNSLDSSWTGLSGSSSTGVKVEVALYDEAEDEDGRGGDTPTPGPSPSSMLVKATRSPKPWMSSNAEKQILVFSLHETHLRIKKKPKLIEYLNIE